MLMDQLIHLVMNIFNAIDDKLNTIAAKYNAEIDKREMEFDGSTRDELELRKIRWCDETFDKSISILPDTVSPEGNYLWTTEVSASANLKTNTDDLVPFWMHRLLEDVPLEEIVQNIDRLLNTSEKLLMEARPADMRLSRDFIDGRLTDPGSGQFI